MTWVREQRGMPDWSSQQPWFAMEQASMPRARRDAPASGEKKPMALEELSSLTVYGLDWWL